MSNYRWQPEEYERSSSQQKKWGLELMDKLRLRGDERILDIGCGDGYLTALLATRVPRGEVVGVDVSPELLLESGLHPLRVELVKKDMVHRGREGIAGWIRSTWLPFTERVPGELREEFIRAVVEEYLAEFPPDRDGLVHVEAIRLEVEAERP